MDLVVSHRRLLASLRLGQAVARQRLGTSWGSVLVGYNEPDAWGQEGTAPGCAGVSAGPWLDGVVPLPRPERSISSVGRLGIIQLGSCLS